MFTNLCIVAGNSTELDAETEWLSDGVQGCSGRDNDGDAVRYSWPYTCYTARWGEGRGGDSCLNRRIVLHSMHVVVESWRHTVTFVIEFVEVS